MRINQVLKERQGASIWRGLRPDGYEVAGLIIGRVGLRPLLTYGGSNARLPSESGAVMLKALESAMDEISILEFNGSVSAGTLLPKWYGERMDMGMAV